MSRSSERRRGALRGVTGLLLLPACAVTLAAESDLTLREGSGRELVQAHCAICHSLDYIEMHAALMDREGWRKSVEKMISVMGAPVPAEDAAVIVDYLATAYGPATRE
jgi:mono/diheme cytochrome c family protein